MTSALPRLTVIGCGYLGAVTAACMADLGYDVIGLDVDEPKIAALATGKSPFYEPGLDEVLTRALASGRLTFTTSVAHAAEHGDVLFLCLGTPQKKDSNAADLTYVWAAIDSIAPLLTRPCLVVGKSTVPVGTAELIADRIHELAPAGTDVGLVWNPEFLREGFAVRDTVAPDRIVVGVTDPAHAEIMRELYAPVMGPDTPFVITDLPTAQLVKSAANAFLATKISFINAMAEMCEATGADVVSLADAIGHDARIGRRFLGAGLGFGGGCLPKDIRGFMARAEELGVGAAIGFLREVDDINTRRRKRAIGLTVELLGGSAKGARVAALGAAFKPDSDDVRDSPALDVARSLHDLGAHVIVHDPKAIEGARRLQPMLTYSSSVEEACTDADVVLHLTEWQEYREIDPIALARLVRTPRLLEARNMLNVPAWREAGWNVKALGRPSP